jgi:hypothetical protein
MLPEGYSYYTETTVNLTVEQEFMGIRYNTQMDINTLLKFKVHGIDSDSNYILAASYQRMDIRVSSLLINMEVSTESILPGDSLSGLLRLIRGKDFKILLSGKGEFINIIGLDEMISETILSGNENDSEKIEFNRNLIQTLGKEALLDNYRSIGTFYTDSPIKDQDNWKVVLNIVKSGIPMELNSNILIKEMTSEIIVLFSEGKIISLHENRENISADPKMPDYYLVGNEISENKFDRKTGLLLESIASQNITGTIKTPVSEENAEEMMIPFKIISRISMATVPFSI